MKVTLTANLGTADCKAFDLELEEALEGKAVDVSPDHATALFKRGLAIEAKQERKKEAATATPATPATPAKVQANG